MPQAAKPSASQRTRWSRWLYGLLLAGLAPLYVLRLWWRGRREPLYRQAIAERFGRYAQAGQPGALWLHAVSLGETRAAAALVSALRHACPGLRLLLTHGTATGREAGRELLRDGDVQVWLPYDTPGATARFFTWFKPAAGVLMETEIWPNLLHAAAAANVPMVLANARLSQQSRERGERFGALLRPAFDSLSLVLAQTEADAQRLRGAGARQVQICGNLKFDVTPGADMLARGRVWRAAVGRPVLLAAVTREGEEAALLAAWQRQAGRSSPVRSALADADRGATALHTSSTPPITPPRGGVESAAGGRETGAAEGAAAANANARTGAGAGTTGVATGAAVASGATIPASGGAATLPGQPATADGVRPLAAAPATSRPPLLVIVPRHPQRFDAVAAMVSATGLRLARRSSWAGGAAGAARETPPPSAIAADVWLGDSLGEMPMYYALAQVALLGGSFEPLGGQNLIEAAACGCPLVMGPHTFNFAEAARLSLLGGASLRVDDVDTAVREALALLQSETQYLMAARAMGFAAQHRGAARRMAASIDAVLRTASTGR